MLKTLWATVQKGKIELLETWELPEGTKVLVTLISQDDESEFWFQASQSSLNTAWNNSEDDIYAQLL
jgi:phage baseplate assembly protein gpV